MEERIENITFEGLVSQIERTNEALQNNARLVINRHVTAKAWLTGCYIVEYEQNDSDRAKYGDRIIPELSRRLGKHNFSTINLKIFRQFYQTYPSLLSEIGKFLLTYTSIGQSLTDLLQLPMNKLIGKSQSQADQSLLNRQSLIAQFPTTTNSSSGQFNGVNPEMLFNRLSFTHFDEDVFVSRYKLSIPSKERMTEFLRKENEGLTRKEGEV